jgi:MFS family permease
MSGRQRLVLYLLLGSQFMLSVDFSIWNVALPQVGAAAGLEVSSLAWVATAYALPAAGFTLLFGRVADLVGRRRLFLIGIALLAVSSVLGGFADSAAVLLTARTLQGLATAIATPAALSLLTTSFPEGPVRDRVLGLNGALLSGGFTAGALLGGVLVGVLRLRGPPMDRRLDLQAGVIGAGDPRHLPAVDQTLVPPNGVPNPVQRAVIPPSLLPHPAANPATAITNVTMARGRPPRRSPYPARPPGSDGSRNG